MQKERGSGVQTVSYIILLWRAGFQVSLLVCSLLRNHFCKNGFFQQLRQFLARFAVNCKIKLIIWQVCATNILQKKWFISLWTKIWETLMSRLAKLQVRVKLFKNLSIWPFSGTNTSYRKIMTILEESLLDCSLVNMIKL